MLRRATAVEEIQRIRETCIRFERRGGCAEAFVVPYTRDKIAEYAHSSVAAAPCRRYAPPSSPTPPAAARHAGSSPRRSRLPLVYFHRYAAEPGAYAAALCFSV
jgi:hypothetical protein